jgi:hypothetical protein
MSHPKRLAISLCHRLPPAAFTILLASNPCARERHLRPYGLCRLARSSGCVDIARHRSRVETNSSSLAARVTLPASLRRRGRRPEACASAGRRPGAEAALRSRTAGHVAGGSKRH